MVEALHLARGGVPVTAGSALQVEDFLVFLMDPACALRLDPRSACEVYTDVAAFLRGEFGVLCDIGNGTLGTDSENDVPSDEDHQDIDSPDGTDVGDLCELGLRKRQCCAARFVSPALQQFTGSGTILPSARDGPQQSPPVPPPAGCEAEAREGMA